MRNTHGHPRVHTHTYKHTRSYIAVLLFDLIQLTAK